MGDFLSGFTGLCAGLISGSAVCAFYIALGVFSKTAISLGLDNVGKLVVICSGVGSVFGTIITVFNANIQVGSFWSCIFGLFAGIYVGIFIACLTEVTKSIPVVKDYGISKNYIVLILFAFAIGKLAGSIIYWISGAF